MADVFIEHMIKQQPSAKTLCMRLLIVLAAAVLIAVPFLFRLAGVNLFTLTPFFIAGAIWGGMFLSKRLNLEFEYILTNGELDVDKIMARTSRKRLLSIDCRAFDILAPMTEKYKNEYTSQAIQRVVDASSSPRSDRRWFAVFQGKDGTRTMLVFEPNDRMLEAFRPFIARKIGQP